MRARGEDGFETRPYRGAWTGRHPHPRIEYGAGTNLPLSRGKGLGGGRLTCRSQRVRLMVIMSGDFEMA